MTHVKGAGIVACPDFAAPGSPYCRWHSEIDAELAMRVVVMPMREKFVRRLAEMRARAERAEAAMRYADKMFEKAEQRATAFKADRDRLRDGIQALADDADAGGFSHVQTHRLRALHNPTPTDRLWVDGNGEETPISQFMGAQIEQLYTQQTPNQETRPPHVPRDPNIIKNF